MKYFFPLLLATGFSNNIVAQAIVKYHSDSVYVFKGTIKLELFYGAPNFGEDPEHDQKEWAYILHVDKTGSLTDTELGNVDSFSTVHLNDINGRLHLKQVINKKVKVRTSLMTGITGHHHAPVITDNLYEVTLIK